MALVIGRLNEIYWAGVKRQHREQHKNLEVERGKDLTTESWSSMLADGDLTGSGVQQIVQADAHLLDCFLSQVRLFGILASL